jgi:GST-like protein
MIDLYSSTTPNVLKIIVMLEETGLQYVLKPVNVWKGEQFEPSFVALNPNSKVPVIVDHDDPDGPYAAFESVAILMYLAEKTRRFLPGSGRPRHDVLQWLIFQAANIGPANGQFNHFERFAGPDNDYAMSRYTTELKRLYDVMEKRLGETPYLGGGEYSIADIATFPWALIQSRRLGERFPFLDRNSGLHPNISTWLTRCEERPGVQRALAVHTGMTSAVATATPGDLDRMFGRGSFAYKG